MAKTEWGSKRVCLNCGAKFYDLNHTPIVCPACETVFDPAANSKPRRSRAPAKAPVAVVAVVKAKVIEPDEADDDEVAVASDDSDDESESENAIEDVSELGDDDMSNVIDADLDEDDRER